MVSSSVQIAEFDVEKSEGFEDEKPISGTNLPNKYYTFPNIMNTGGFIPTSGNLLVAAIHGSKGAKLNI
jgi:hypothetical protein